MSANLTCPGSSADDTRDIWETNTEEVICWAPFSQEAIEPLGGCCNASIAVAGEWPQFYDFPNVQPECLIWCSMTPGNGTEEGSEHVYTEAMRCLSEYRNSTLPRVRCNQAREPPHEDSDGNGGDGDGSETPGDSRDGEDTASLVRSGSMTGLAAVLVSLLLASGIAF